MSRLLIGHRPYEDFKYPLAVMNYRILQKLLTDVGQEATVFAVLEPACIHTNKVETECRKMKIVQVYINALNANIPFEELPSLASCEFIVPLAFTDYVPEEEESSEEVSEEESEEESEEP